MSDFNTRETNQGCLALARGRPAKAGIQGSGAGE